MASKSQITVTVVDSKQNITRQKYQLAYLPAWDKAVVSIALAQITPKEEKVLSVSSMATHQKEPVTKIACDPSIRFKEQLMNLMFTIIRSHFEKASCITVTIETGNRFEFFRMHKLKATSLRTIERFILPKALQMLGENLLQPTAVSQSYHRQDYDVSYKVCKGKPNFARHFVQL